MSGCRSTSWALTSEPSRARERWSPVTERVVAHHAVEHGVRRPFPGWAEHDADEVWWGDVTTIIHALLRQAAVDPIDVAAVGVSALAPAMLPGGCRWPSAASGILYGIDTRAHLEIERLNRELGWDTADASPARRLQAQSVSPKIVWFREHEPERWRSTQDPRSDGLHRPPADRGVVDPEMPRRGRRLYDPGNSWDPAMCDRFRVPIQLLLIAVLPRSSAR